MSAKVSGPDALRDAGGRVAAEQRFGIYAVLAFSFKNKTLRHGSKAITQALEWL